jgi:hypothetical protein
MPVSVTEKCRIAMVRPFEPAATLTVTCSLTRELDRAADQVHQDLPQVSRVSASESGTSGSTLHERFRPPLAAPAETIAFSVSSMHLAKPEADELQVKFARFDL